MLAVGLGWAGLGWAGGWAGALAGCWWGCAGLDWGGLGCCGVWAGCRGRVWVDFIKLETENWIIEIGKVVSRPEMGLGMAANSNKHLLFISVLRD